MSESGSPQDPSLVRLGQLATVLGVIVLVGLLVFGLATKATDDSIDQALRDGSAIAAPGFELDLFDIGALPRAFGKRFEAATSDDRIGLNEVLGTPVVLNFWASWCLPCRDEAPLLERGWQRWGQSGVLFLGLNMQDLSDDARKFLDEFSIDYPTIRDPGKTVSAEYGLTGIPETFFIDVRGRVVAHAIGVLTEEQLAAGVRAARTGRVGGTFTGGDFRPPAD